MMKMAFDEITVFIGCGAIIIFGIILSEYIYLLTLL